MGMSLPNDKILDQSKLKALADDTMDMEKKNLFWEGLETFWEKEKMLITSIFSFS